LEVAEFWQTKPILSRADSFRITKKHGQWHNELRFANWQVDRIADCGRLINFVASKVKSLLNIVLS